MLPQWRGPAPIQYSILSGQIKTGVSIIDLHPKIIDAGNILLQDPFEIPNHKTIKYLELENLLAEIGGRLTSQVLTDFEKYWEARREQVGEISQSKKISKSDGIISFKNDSFEEISQKVRALNHQIPIKILDLIPGKQIILEEIRLNEQLAFGGHPELFYDKVKGTVVFRLKDGKSIEVKKFKIEGKSQIFTAGSFYSNYLRTRP